MCQFMLLCKNTIAGLTHIYSQKPKTSMRGSGRHLLQRDSRFHIDGGSNIHVARVGIAVAEIESRRHAILWYWNWRCEDSGEKESDLEEE